MEGKTNVGESRQLLLFSHACVCVRVCACVCVCVRVGVSASKCALYRGGRVVECSKCVCTCETKIVRVGMLYSPWARKREKDG